MQISNYGRRLMPIDIANTQRLLKAIGIAVLSIALSTLVAFLVGSLMYLVSKDIGVGLFAAAITSSSITSILTPAMSSEVK